MIDVFIIFFKSYFTIIPLEAAIIVAALGVFPVILVVVRSSEKLPTPAQSVLGCGFAVVSAWGLISAVTVLLTA